MNILYIFHHIILPYKGGVERVTSLLSDEFRIRGHNVCYLAINASDEKELIDPAESHCRQYFLDIDSRDTALPLKHYREILDNEGIDVVISQQPILEALMLLRHTPPAIKRISCFHLQPFAYIGWERRVKKTLYPKTMKSRVFRIASILFPLLYRRQIIARGRKTFYGMADVSDRVVVLSEKFIQRVVRYTPDIDHTRLAWINNPNTFNLPENIGDKGQKYNKKENILLYVGRFEPPQKNMFGFIDFWRDFSKLKPEWKAYVLGDGEDRPLLEKYASKQHLKNLIFMGHCKDVASYYHRASFVCLTSHSEGWGMVLTEGMAYGCIPVCFGSYEAASDIIDDDQNGIIATPFNTMEMASRVSNLIDSPRKMSLMSEKPNKK